MIRLFLEPDSASLTDRGENHLNSAHLRSFTYHDFDDRTNYVAMVQSSMKQRRNKVEITVRKDQNNNNERNSITGHCQCERGNDKCGHMAAVLLYIHKTVSCTDKLASWSNPGLIEEETQTIEEMLKQPASKEANEEALIVVRNTCRKYFFAHQVCVPAAWLLQKESLGDEPCNVILGKENLERIISSVDFFLASDKKDVLKLFSFSVDEIAEVAAATVGQRANHLYLTYKKYRITASNFGFVIGALQRKSYPKTLFGRLLNSANLEKVKAIQWGKQSEPHAFKVLVEKYNLGNIRQCGFYLHTSGLLGATPDGIGENFTIEIKCPYSHRKLKLREALIAKKQNLKGNYVLYYLEGSDQIHVNKDHPYFHQVQGQIHLCKKDFGYLFIWTTVSHLLVKIKKDPLWESNINAMEMFYYDEFIPYIMSQLH